MGHTDDKNSRRKLRLAIVFAALIFILVLATARIAIHHAPSHVVFILVGVAGMALNFVAWILLSRKTRKQGQRIKGGAFSFIAASIASAASIAYGCGVSHFSQYAVYIVIVCIAISCLIKMCRPSKADGPFNSF